MYRKQFLLIIAVLALVTLACGVDVDIPPLTTDIKTGPTVTEDINIPHFGDPNAIADIALQFSAGELYLQPGADGDLIQGSVIYNVADFKPEIALEDSNVEIRTGSLEIDGIPNFKEKVKNIWDFRLANTPINLDIKAGAYKSELQLGNLALTNLHIADGAADVEIDFRYPNLVEMQTLRYETGASNIFIERLGNANFGTMIFESGAGTYELDFSGDWQRDANIFIETGLSTMTLVVPEHLNATLSLEGGLTNVTTRGAWEQSGSNYTLTGNGPRLTFTVEMSAGNLTLRTP
jgi:hypothetical protein